MFILDPETVETPPAGDGSEAPAEVAEEASEEVAE